VFAHWQSAMGKPRARLDAKRSKAITARLSDGYDVATLCRAIDGCRASTWHQGANDRGAKFNDLELICRDAKHVDQFVEIANNGEPRPMSPITQHNARALGLIESNRALPSGTEAPTNDSPGETPCGSDRPGGDHTLKTRRGE
jgi:hypothetical protein